MCFVENSNDIKTYTQQKKRVHRQGIGIPMGRNDASHVGNIFLDMYEKTYFEHLQENYQPEIIAKFGYP